MATNIPFPTEAYPRMDLPSHRPKEMKVLALGMPRTGTLSLYIALQELGYTCYHMTECCLNHRSNSLINWNQAIDAKYNGKGRPFSGVDFDKMLWRYDAVTDFPCVLFVEELMNAYPDAQIILSTRDLDSWLPSMEWSLYAILRIKRLKILGLFDSTYTRPFLQLIRSALSAWTDGDWKDRDRLAAGYVAHYAHVRGIAQRRGHKVLEFRVQDDWGPLCEFLKRERPNKPFPRASEGDFITQYQYIVFWPRLLSVLRPVVGSVVLYYFAVWVAVWWFEL
ncbi:hypothetical protein BDW59DRAFT_160517 [Aspergillus cavernicola]|uniref:NAD dependent epimerase/dehydratase n=1 Tax=Aspergillus cavernicola TaxID=176166 RepID=A0ABR4IHH8_9EURO